jgi:hypothetical protein
MIGEMIGELTGKTVGTRILHHHQGGELKIERTIEAKGKILGEEVTFIATSWAMERPEGGTFTRGNGVMITKKGEKAVLHGAGISLPGTSPGWNFRGARYLQTKSPALSRLNNVALVFEISITPDGTYHDKMWEWK